MKVYKNMTYSIEQEIDKMKARKHTHAKGKIIGISIGVLLVVLCISVIRYLTFYHSVDEEALAAMRSNEKVLVKEIGNTIVFTPKEQNATIGYVYYPGGQVESKSFAYAANEIAQSGIMVIIQKMPFHLAMFGADRAFSVIDAYPDVKQWYIGGFSLGGVSACMAASKQPEAFQGVILYASYTTKNYSLADSHLRVLSVSGSKDGLATADKIENGKLFLPKDTTYIQIPGGNHTQMAIYGDGKLQKGDNKAGLERMEQQEILIKETRDFILQEEKPRK